jgi:hypothetical protein
MPTGTPKAPGPRQKAFSCGPKWQGLSGFELSTTRALKSSIGVRLVFDAESAIDVNGAGSREGLASYASRLSIGCAKSKSLLGASWPKSRSASDRERSCFASHVSFFTRFPAPKCHE